MAHSYFLLLRDFSRKMYTKFFKSLLATIFNNLLKYANYALLYICVRKLKKNFHTTFFHYIFHSSDTIGPFL